MDEIYKNSALYKWLDSIVWGTPNGSGIDAAKAHQELLEAAGKIYGMTCDRVEVKIHGNA